jgi:hypothetical protein
MTHLDSTTLANPANVGGARSSPRKSELTANDVLEDFFDELELDGDLADQVIRRLIDAGFSIVQPSEPRFDASELEVTLISADHMADITVTLIEKAFEVYKHYGDVAYHEKRRREPKDPCGTYIIHEEDEDTLLWSLYETRAKIREARDLFCGTDDDAPAKAVAEAQ